MTRAGLIDTVVTILKAVQTPVLQGVYVGEPYEPPNDRVAALWYTGDSTWSMSLGDVGVREHFEIAVYWKPGASPQGRQNLELEMWDANRAIQAGLRAQSKLGGNCDDLEIAEAQVGWVDIGGTRLRIVRIPWSAMVFATEPIVP